MLSAPSSRFKKTMLPQGMLAPIWAQEGAAAAATATALRVVASEALCSLMRRLLELQTTQPLPSRFCCFNSSSPWSVNTSTCGRGGWDRRLAAADDQTTFSLSPSPRATRTHISRPPAGSCRITQSTASTCGTGIGMERQTTLSVVVICITHESVRAARATEKLYLAKL